MLGDRASRSCYTYSMRNNLIWMKSSHSITNENCVEAVWVKSSYSGHANCMEMSARPQDTAIAVRDSKHPEGTPLVFTAAAWDTFTRGL